MVGLQLQSKHFKQSKRLRIWPTQSPNVYWRNVSEMNKKRDLRHMRRFAWANSIPGRELTAISSMLLSQRKQSQWSASSWDRLQLLVDAIHLRYAAAGCVRRTVVRF